MHQNLVTIGLPVYNGARYVGAAIESNLGQSYRNIELIISDNGSTDETAEICTRYARCDSRVRYVRQAQNIGVNRNHTLVFDLASRESRFFRWAAGDDLASADLIEQMVLLLNDDARVVAVVPDTINIDEEGRQIRHVPRTLDLRVEDVVSRVQAVLTRGYQMVFTQGLMRKATLLETSRRWHYFGWDFVLLLELVLAGQIAQPEGPILYRRHHEGAASMARTLSAYKAWVDPTRKVRFLLPHWRLSVERLRAVLAGPVPSRAKGTALLWVIRHSWWGRRELANDVVTSYKNLLGTSDDISF